MFHITQNSSDNLPDNNNIIIITHTYLSALCHNSRGSKGHRLHRKSQTLLPG